MPSNVASALAVTVVTTIGLPAQVALAQPAEPPLHLDPVRRTLWSDDKLGLRFTYPSVWQQAIATQPSTRVVINWRLSKSKALLATCYVEAHGSEASSLADAEPEQIHKNSESIAQSALRNFQFRSPNARLVEARAAFQDGHPVIFLIREGVIETLDRTIHTKSYSIVTAWRGKEVNFECGTSMYGPDVTALGGGQRLASQVEAGIFNVLRTLQFDRVAR